MQKRIKYFLSAANCLNFTVAAQQMFITQQAMTRQISLLEDELGVKLFERSTKRVSLTAAGKVCRDEFMKLNTALDMAVQRIQNTALANTSVVTVGFYYFFSRDKIITPIMESLYKKFPDVNFKINLYNFREMRHSLLEGKIDVCVAVSSDWQRWANIKANILCSLPIKLFVSSKHPLAANQLLPIEKLAEYSWLTTEDKDILRPNTLYWYSKIPYKAKVMLDDFLTVLAYLGAGQGFSLQPPVFQGYDSPALKAFELPFEDAALDLISVYREDLINPLVLSIAKQIKKIFTSGNIEDLFPSENRCQVP